MDAESTSHDQNPCVPAEQFHECLDKLKQGMQKINDDDEVIDTLSNLSLKQQKEGHCDDCVEVEKLNSDASDTDVVSKFPESKEGIPIKPRGAYRSLPRIYYKTTNPSLDEEDGEVWRYVYVRMYKTVIILL